MHVLLTGEAYVPDLRCRVFVLPTLIKNRHILRSVPRGSFIYSGSGRSTVSPLLGPCSAFPATWPTAAVVGTIPVLYSPRGNQPTRRRLPLTTSIALQDTLARFCSTRPRSSKGSFSRGDCRGAREGWPIMANGLQNDIK